MPEVWTLADGEIQRLWTEVRQMGGEVTLHTVYAFLSNTKAV